MNHDLHIRLGPHWSRFSYQHDELKMLGTVQQGPGIGALALRPDGRYVQLNGDVERVLNTARVNVALQKAQHASGGSAGHAGHASQHANHHSARPMAPPPVVIVKKRRVLVPQE